MQTSPAEALFRLYMDKKDLTLSDFEMALNLERDLAVDTSKVTRFEVIDHSAEAKGRFVVEHGKSVELSLQDDGRTLKVFLK
jgi:hypothetical protein